MTRIMILVGTLFFMVLSISTIPAQDLQSVRKLIGRKTSVFLGSGAFHNGNIRNKSSLKAIRHSYIRDRGYERVVFDFGTKTPPGIYGFISKKEKKIYIDFFNTELSNEAKSFGNSRYVKNIDFYPITKEILSVEMNFKQNSAVDIFYLESPARLVVDIKK